MCSESFTFSVTILNQKFSTSVRKLLYKFYYLIRTVAELTLFNIALNFIKRYCDISYNEKQINPNSINFNMPELYLYRLSIKFFNKIEVMLLNIKQTVFTMKFTSTVQKFSKTRWAAAASSIKMCIYVHKWLYQWPRGYSFKASTRLVLIYTHFATFF